MGLLVYNHATDRYEGDRVAAPVARFAVLVADLVADGVPEGQARRSLLEESIWIVGLGGVQFLDPVLCLYCRAPLSPPRERFCDAVCEAAFYVAVRE